MKSLLGGYFFQPASEKQFSSLTAKVELLKNKYPICLSGTVDIQVWSTRDNSKTYRLDSPNKGLFVEGLIWRVMKNFSSDAVLLVLASEHYDKADYIFDFNKFASICDSYSTDEPVLD